MQLSVGMVSMLVARHSGQVSRDIVTMSELPSERGPAGALSMTGPSRQPARQPAVALPFLASA
jgi:hypothetical protein